MPQSFLDVWNKYDVWGGQGNSGSGLPAPAPKRENKLEETVKKSGDFLNNYLTTMARNEQQQAAVKREQVFQTRATPEERKQAELDWKRQVVNSPAQKFAEDRLQKGGSSGSFHAITEQDHYDKARLQKGAYSGSFTVVTEADAEAARSMSKGSWSGASTYLPETERKRAEAQKKAFQQTLTDQHFLNRDKQIIKAYGGAPPGFIPYQPKSTRPTTIEDIKAKMTHDVMQRTQPNNPKYAGEWQRPATTKSQIQYDMNNNRTTSSRIPTPAELLSGRMNTAYSQEMKDRAAAANPANAYQQKFGKPSTPAQPAYKQQTFWNAGVTRGANTNAPTPTPAPVQNSNPFWNAGVTRRVNSNAPTITPPTATFAPNNQPTEAERPLSAYEKMFGRRTSSTTNRYSSYFS